MRPQPTPPRPGQESVWDYPRPPRLEPACRRIVVTFAGATIADTTRAWRVLETSHPPVYYLPQVDVAMQYLDVAPGRSFCEFKGLARYYSVSVDGHTAERAAWSYPDPTPAFRPITGHLAFYASAMDECLVDGERARAQPGGFYGGWITSHVAGPFKGEPGSMGW